MDFIEDLKENKKLLNLIKSILVYEKPFLMTCFEATMIEENKCFDSEEEEKKFNGLFSNIISNFLRPYYKHKLFPSATFMFDLFFFEIKECKNNSKGKTEKSILERVINNIEIFKLLEDTLVIHPLADFGFQNIGGSLYFSKSINNIYFSLSDFIVFPQANNLKKALKNIQIAMRHFKLPTIGLSKELFEHYQRSRNTKWLVKNPIIIHRIKQSYEGYYENQYFIIKQLEMNLSLTYLTKCLSENNKLEDKRFLNTTNTNNFQTYDEFHYFILSLNNSTNKYEPNCIPRHYKLSRLFDTFKLNITLPLNFNNTDKKKINKISYFLNKIYCSIYESNNNENYHIFRRSLGYFVRSYQAEYYEDSILFLSIAFEMLLGEKVKENISGHIANIILFLKKGNCNDVIEFKKLYASRSGVAHEGNSRECDLQYCQYLYFEIFLCIIEIEEKGIKINCQTFLTDYINNICHRKLKLIPELK